jgi:hypothetical protein
MYDDIQDLLDFGTTTAYYVVMRQGSHIYYLLDATHDYTTVKWTRTRECAIAFYKEDEAAKQSRNLRISGRQGVSIITAEINVLDGLSGD